jgi:hypothetical protein
VYSVNLRIGSYTASSLQAEITKKLNSVRRTQGIHNGSLLTGNYHFFVVTLDINTDIVTFTSLIMTNLPNNPFSTTAGTGVILVNSPGHGYKTNSNIYIYGSKQVGGIPGVTFDGFQIITVINSNTFTFQVNVNAASTATGGGNVLQSGQKAPFQLLWGEYDFTVAQNIGYPLEDSSQLIYTNISSLQNIFQMIINLVVPHNFSKTYAYIGNSVNIGYTLNGNFVTFNSYEIVDITGLNSLLVSVSSNDEYLNLSGNSQAVYLQFNQNIFQVFSYEQYIIPSILVNTYTSHNYTLSDVNIGISIVNTSNPAITNDPSYDGNYNITSVPSSTSLILPGVIGNINVHTDGNYGNISRQSPISTWIVYISSFLINYRVSVSGITYSKITTVVPHLLNTGDYIFFNNVNSSPILSTSYRITSVLSSYSFEIQLVLSNLDTASILKGQAFIGTGLITISYPSHGFNTILSISNGTPVTSVVGSLTITTLPLIITTITNHNLSDNNLVRLSNTQTTPNIDGGGYIVTVISSDTFSIVNPNNSFVALTNVPVYTSGNYPILGLSNNFYLYGVEDIAGISKTLLNNTLFQVRDIKDLNTFTFIMQNAFANDLIKGGGSEVYISSLRHGYSGIQTNTKNGILNRSINLEGENYCFLTCPTLGTIRNTGKVNNIFARISLDQSPGFLCSSYLSNPKIFNTVPLALLSELEFSVVSYNNTLYEFFDLDYSFCLEITEVIDQVEGLNISSKRGIVDTK